jgi:hypothetical protein
MVTEMYKPSMNQGKFSFYQYYLLTECQKLA